jgi:hypothetical protein
MRLGSALGTLALVLVSAGAGWVLHGLALPDPEPAATQPPPPASMPMQGRPHGSLMAFPESVPAPGADAVQLHADGSASLNVQHKPPAWVLAELCRQGARGLPGCAQATAQVAPTPGTAPAAAPIHYSGDSAVLHRLNDASEQVRFDSLQQARAQGVLVPKDTLLAIMRNDPSERMRQEAFEDYVDASSGTLQELRAAMQEALRVPSTVIQTQAREQLDLLEHAEREDAESPVQRER